MKFNERLRYAREKIAGLTQQQLVDRLPKKHDGSPMMSQANLAKMESNENTVGSNYSFYIAKVCGVNPEWLINEDGPIEEIFYKTSANSPEAKVLMAMENMDPATKYQVVKITIHLLNQQKQRKPVSNIVKVGIQLKLDF